MASTKLAPRDRDRRGDLEQPGPGPLLELACAGATLGGSTAVQRELVASGVRCARRRPPDVGPAPSPSAVAAASVGIVAVRMAQHDYWRVDVALPRGDVEALRLGAPRVIPSERHAVITELAPDGSDGDSLLSVEVLGGSQSEAIEAASRAYADARRASGLPPSEAEILGLMTPLFLPEPWDRLWKDAEKLHADGRDDLAVVRAQTSLEVFAATALEQVCRVRLGKSGPAAAKHCRNSLRDDRTVDLIHAISGQRVTECDWWSAYVTHIKRRNDIAHRGVIVTPEQAAASLTAVQACRRWLRELWATA